MSKLSYRNFQNVNGFSQPYVEEKCSHQVEAKMSITSTSVSTSLATPVMTTTMWQTTLASFPRRKPTSHKRHQERRKHDHHHRRRRDLWRPASKVAQTVGLKIQKIALFIKRLDFIDMSVGSIKRLYCSQVIQTILNVRSTSLNAPTSVHLR